MTAPLQNVCTPWVDESALACAVGMDPDVVAEAIAVASELCFTYSGSKFAGSCSETAIIERERWEQSRCDPWEVTLGAYPVTSITEVREAGVVLDAARYRINNWRTLERLGDTADGPRLSWDLTDGLEIDFFYGIMPPADGVRAAKDMACELIKAWTDPEAECQVSEQITSLSRQGVSMDMLVLRPEEYRDGFIGIKSVDRFISARNPGRTRRSAGILNPDLRRRHRRGT